MFDKYKIVKNKEKRYIPLIRRYLFFYTKWFKTSVDSVQSMSSPNIEDVKEFIEKYKKG